MSDQNQFQLDVQNVLEQFNNTTRPVVIYKAGCVPVVCDFDYAQEVLSGVARKRGDCIGMDYLAYNGDGSHIINALKGVHPRLLPTYSRDFKVWPFKQHAFPCEHKDYYYYCEAVYKTAKVMYRMEEDKKAA